MKLKWCLFWLILLVGFGAAVLVLWTYAGSEQFTVNTPMENVLMSGWLNNLGWVAKASSNWVPTEATDDQIMSAPPGQLVVVYDTDPNVPQPLASAKGYFVSLALPDVAFQIDCGFDFRGMTVGYFDEIDRTFINAIISGYRMDPSDIDLVRLKYSEVDDLNKRMTLDIDRVITFIIPQSPFHKHIQMQRVSAMGFETLDIDRINIFQPAVKLEHVKLRTLFNNSKREDDTRLPYLNAMVVRVPAPDPALPPAPAKETFITQLNLDNATTDSTYKCYGDDKIDIRALCESAYDVDGLPKLYGKTVWDNPCVKDTDCPFYDTAAARGGCKANGMCELPVAVKRLGYRKYDASGVNMPFKTPDGSYIFSQHQRINS